MLIDKPRLIEDADRAFFKIMAESRSNVPVILIVTKKDDLEDKLESRIRRELKLSGCPADEMTTRIEAGIRSQLMFKKEGFLKAFSELPDAQFMGPLICSQCRSDLIIR